MVFEKPVVEVLNRFLGDYIENLDANQLKIGIWGGDVVLNNLILKQSALADLDLPVQTVFGRLGKLVLKIPWKNLYGAAVEVSIEGLYLLVKPNNQVKYNAEKEEKRLQDEKKAELQKIDDAKKKAKEETKTDDTFVEKLVAQIVKNVQLSIKNIHVRYEGNTSNGTYGFGITMSSLVVQTTDEDWKPTVVQEMVTKIYKIVSLEGLSVYWNCNPNMYSDKSEGDMEHQFLSDIATKEHVPENYKYILGPINSAARLILNPKPEKDEPPFLLPKAHAELVIEKLSIGLTKCQYLDLLDFAETMSLQACGAQYRKYRPDVPSYRGHYKEWWHFAYKCVLENEVKRRKRNWDWQHMLEHRTMCKSYGSCYKNKLNKKITKEEQQQFAELENQLDLFNLVLIRQRIELEVERLDKDKEKVPAKGWFSSWWGGKADNEVQTQSENILSKFQEAMTAEEKQKLFKAIDYKENTQPLSYPPQYVDTIVRFHMKLFEFSVVNDSVSLDSVVKLRLSNVKLNVEQKPVTKSLKAAAYVEDLVLYGTPHNDLLPEVVSSKENVKSALLDVLFELNPTDTKCAQRLHVTAKPLKIIYDAYTISQITEVFKIPESTSLDQLTDATASKLNDIKDVSATGLQHIIDEHAGIDLLIKISAPFVIIPYGGVFRGSENVLVVNLGVLHLKSVQRLSDSNVREMSKRGMGKDEMLTELVAQSYDKYIVELTNLQIMIAQSDEEYMGYILGGKSESSPMHLLKPLNLHLYLEQCLVKDNPLLPLMKITGNLPSLDVNIIDTRLLLLYDLSMSVVEAMQEGGTLDSATALKKFGGSNTSMASTIFQGLDRRSNPKIPNAPTAQAALVQLTTLQISFELKDLSLELSRQETLSSPIESVAKFSLNHIKCMMTQQTFNMIVDVTLESVLMIQCIKGVNRQIISSNDEETGDTKTCLFNVNYVTVNKKSPEFKDKYKSCESILLLRFARLNLRLDQLALLDLMKFANDLQVQMQEIRVEDMPLKASANALLRQTASSLAGSRNQLSVPTETPRRKRINHNVLFKVIANLEKLSVTVVSDRGEISRIGVTGFSSDVIMKQAYMQISTSLEDLFVLDLNPKTKHTQIISVEPMQKAVVVALKMNNTDVVSAECDMDIKVTVGCIKVCFVNWYITNMLRFLDQFQEAQQAIAEASEKAVKSAKDNVSNLYQKATRMMLDINVKAPEIFVPENSKSMLGLLLDLGRITLTNTIYELEGVNNAEHKVFIDDLNIKLEALKIERVKMDEESREIERRVPLLKPLSFVLNVKRNLSTWYKTVPGMDISGNIDIINLMLAQTDYDSIMKIVNENLTEGARTSASETQNPVLGPAISEANQTVEVTTSTSAELLEADSNVTTVLRWNLVMNCFKINLFHVSTDDMNSDDVTRTGLAEMAFEGFSVRGRMMSNNALSNALLLVNCLLIDSRPGREGKINSLLSRIEDTNDTSGDSTVKNMIDVTFQQKNNDTFVDVRVYSFTFILSVEYMLALSNFFTASMEAQSNKQQSMVSVKSAPQPAKKTQVTQAQASMMTVTLKIENPYIVLVENMDSIDTRALILNSEILLKLRMTGDRQTINGSINDAQLYTCIFDPSIREATKNSVLEPLSISIAGSTPEDKGLHIEVHITSIVISVSLQTIELISNILQTLNPAATGSLVEEETLTDRTDLWEIKRNEDGGFWFLHEEEQAIEAVNFDFKKYNRVTKSNELCILTVPLILIKLEVGISNKTFPMLMFESHVQARVSDWSTQLVVDASMSFEVGYYNSFLGLWEPLIEPISVESDEGWTFVPWELRLEVTMNDVSEEATQSPANEDPEIISMQPAMSIDISSNNNLELTLTKTALEVLNNLGNLFASAMKQTEMLKVADEAPFKIVNATGLEIELLVRESKFHITDADLTDIVKLETGAEVQLESMKAVSENMVRVLSEISKPVPDRYLHIRIPAVDTRLKLPIVRSETRYFKLPTKNATWGLISSVKIDNGVTRITLSSILQIHNTFNVPVDLYYMRNTGNELEFISTIQSGGSMYVPMHAVYSQTSELFFSVENYSVTTTPYVWRDLELDVSVTKNLKCCSKQNKEDSFVIRVIGVMTQVYYENTMKHTMASTLYNIYLRPAVILKNCLPVDVQLYMQNIADEKTIKPGDSLELPYLEPGKSYLVLRLGSYLEKEWSCRRDIPSLPQTFSVWTFESHDGATKMALDLGMHVLNQNDSFIMSLYCPFWMVNKTGLNLSYRSTDENLNIMHHPPFYKSPILFSFNAKNFFGKKKACVRIEQGDWSEKFSIDVAGSAGVVVCKNQGKIHQIGVSNQLTYNGLTKMITFTPYFVILNHSMVAIETQEMGRPADPWVAIQSKSCSSIWPYNEEEEKLIRLRVAGTEEMTAPFLITESHITLLKLKNKYGGINVDIQLTEGGIYINLALFEEGMAPGVIINDTKHTINIWEKESVQIRKLPPKHNMAYTWENPSADRVLVWEGGYKKEYEDDLRMDGLGEYSITETDVVYWTSFLDGMQRILLFTCNRQVFENVQYSKDIEVIDSEINLSIYGVGLSLVNNLDRQELMYIGIASTGIIWETCKPHGRRYKQMSTKDNMLIENAYQSYLTSVLVDAVPNIPINDSMEVNFDLMIMVQPHRRKMRRRFQTGLWLQMKSSAHQMQLHAKINRLQIDNQLYDCTFPVMFAPVPPPKTVSTNAHKPFAELSIVQLVMKNSQIRQFKYFKVLIQEFHVKVDLGFINAIMEFFDSGANTEEEQKRNFLLNIETVEQPLYQHVSTQSLQEQKSFYDVLHFSPLKIHLSFSMSAGNKSQGIGNIPVFLSVLLQGIGVTLTDLQDVVFKLAYFEREFTFLTQPQLISEAMSHYVGQTVKQLYVLVLGLDVIGNPYGLVVGITQGVEDLFYEPFQGAIQGPGEFAEGLVLGISSLLGHTVGGAAGAVSKITGAMGKGIAALTFDKDYQRKRRDQINKRPATVQEGLARGGKGLVMGVVDGVTGVFTKPISGAKEQGFGGFFKGLGKGAVGLVTRPTAGVMDFASTSFETVKRVTDFGHEYVTRLRPPRFVPADCNVRPYNLKLAFGNKLLCELEKGKYYSTDIYASHYVIIEKKEIILLSNKRIAYITHNDIFGGWQVEWSYTWQELDKPPEFHMKGVQIFHEGKKKGLFHSGDHGKVILLSDKVECEKLVRDIKKHLLHK